MLSRKILTWLSIAAIFVGATHAYVISVVENEVNEKTSEVPVIKEQYNQLSKDFDEFSERYREDQREQQRILRDIWKYMPKERES